jgi:hypothetical protein
MTAQEDHPMTTPAIPPPAAPRTPSSAAAYVLTILGVAFCAIAAIVLIEVTRPTTDNLPLAATIIGFAGATIASISAIIKSERVEGKVDEVHLSLNSRLTEWMTAMAAASDERAAAARAEGVTAGRGQPPEAPP